MRQWGLANIPLDPLLVSERVIRNPQTCSFSLLRPSRHYSQLCVSASEGGLMKREPQQTGPDVIRVCVCSRWWSACVFIELSSLRVIMALRWCYILKTRPLNPLSLKRWLVWWCGNNHIRASVTCSCGHSFSDTSDGIFTSVLLLQWSSGELELVFQLKQLHPQKFFRLFLTLMLVQIRLDFFFCITRGDILTKFQLFLSLQQKLVVCRSFKLHNLSIWLDWFIQRFLK